MSLAERLALGMLLLTLVLASFAVPPSRRATAEAVAVARAAPIGRGMVRAEVADEPIAETVAPLVPPSFEEPMPSLPVAPPAETIAPPASPPRASALGAAAVALPASIAVPIAAAPAPPAVAVSASAAETQMLALMNKSRTQGGLAPLSLDAAVSAIARGHSAVEARVRDVYHDGADGTARSRDASACGSGWYGENTGRVWNGNVSVLHQEFMSEPWAPINHRTNIMDPTFRRAGVGAVAGPDALYMTMVFCR